MAGIFDRLAGNDKIAIHHLTAILVLNADGEMTNGESLTAINGSLATPLDSAGQTDMVNLKAELVSAGDKGRYMHKLESQFLAVEGDYDKGETAFRAYLGIS